METPRLINTHDQLRAAGGGIAISRAWAGFREKYLYGWQITRYVQRDGATVQVVTDPKAAWYDYYGRKVFPKSGEGTHHEEMAAAFRQATAWVAEKYGEQGPWKRNAMGDYVPERINKQFPLPKRKKGE